MQRTPGQGMSRKAIQRRNRRQTVTIARTQRFSQPAALQTVRPKTVTVTTSTTQRRRRRSINRNRNGQNQNSWTSSLMDPCNKGARVPDPFTMTATGVFQTQTDQYFYANNQGVTGFIIDPRSLTEYYLKSDATAAAFTWSQPAPYTIDESTRNFLDGQTSQWRVVSACIDVVYTGTTAEDSGTACGFVATGGQIGASSLTGFTGRYLPDNFTEVNDLIDSNQFPVRNGMRVLWKPLDTVRATEFFQLDSSQGFQSTQASYFGYFAFGMKPNATIATRVTTNYEFVPKNDSIDVIPTQRPDFEQSKMDWKKAWDWVSDKSNKVTPLFGGWSGAANAAAQFLGSQLFNGRRIKTMAAPAA